MFGNGNVALDVARMLALTPEELAITDVADRALVALRDSAVEEIMVLEDHAAGLLPEPSGDRDELLRAMSAKGVAFVEYDGWRSIDEHERSSGEPHGRPRIKLVRRDDLLARARPR